MSTENKPIVENENRAENKPDSEKSYEELKAEAENLEAQLKDSKDSEKSKEDELKQNMLIRKRKAQEALDKKNSEASASPETETLDTRDLVFLETNEIAEGSEKANILAKYKAGGLIKSYKEGLAHPGVKAEFEAIDAKDKAAAVLDENDTPDNQLKTKKEIVAGYRKSGEVPTDKKLQAEIANANLEEIGI